MSRRLILVFIASLLLPFAASQTQAAHCADANDRPAVCTVEVRAGLEGGAMNDFNITRPAEIQPNQVFLLQFDAFDQSRRRFPKDRLAYDFDAGACRNVVKPERIDTGRFALRAGANPGRCEILFWIPGNLNLEWRLTLEVAARAGAKPLRSEANFITECLYQALLRRDPDSQGLLTTSAAIERGQLSSRIDEIVRSDEFRTKVRDAHPNWLLEQLYLGILGRKPDTSGIQAFKRKIELGQISEVVRELLDSAEFKRRLAER